MKRTKIYNTGDYMDEFPIDFSEDIWDYVIDGNGSAKFKVKVTMIAEKIKKGEK